MSKMRPDRVEAEDITSSEINEPSKKSIAQSSSGRRFSKCRRSLGREGLVENGVGGTARACRSAGKNLHAVWRWVCQFSDPPTKSFHKLVSNTTE